MQVWPFGVVDLLRIPAEPAHGDCPECPTEWEHSVSIALRRTTATTPEHPLGRCTLIDADRPDAAGSAALVLRLPLDRLGPHLRPPAGGTTDLIDSPLHDVMASHMLQLAADADKLSTDANAGAIGDACVELAAALLASATGRANPAASASAGPDPSGRVNSVATASANPAASGPASPVAAGHTNPTAATSGSKPAASQQNPASGRPCPVAGHVATVEPDRAAPPTRRPRPADTLLDRIRQFVRTEATDPDLGPATIAAAHNLSVRSLYRLCAEAGISLRQWIIEERVAHAAALLADRADLTVTAIAHASGFRDATHFTRRFRARYGATPAAWRHRYRAVATREPARDPGRAESPRRTHPGRARVSTGPRTTWTD